MSFTIVYRLTSFGWMNLRFNENKDNILYETARTTEEGNQLLELKNMQRNKFWLYLNRFFSRFI